MSIEKFLSNVVVDGTISKVGGTSTQFLKADGSIDTNVVPYTGAVSNTDLGEYQLKAGQVEFDQTPTGTAGIAKLRWNDTDGTLDLGLKGGNVVLQVGQEQVVRIVNKTGTNLLEANYQVVYISGAQGNRLKVNLALANSDLTTSGTIGIVTETINDNQEGFITSNGLVRGINTTGSLQGETWADGDILYVSPTVAGKLTNIKPIAPQHLVTVGVCVLAHITQGSIFVKVDNGYELEELHNVLINTPLNNDALIYETSTGLWKNKTISTVLGYTPENVANKSDSYTVSSSTTYASTKAVVDGLATKQNTLTNPITGTGTTNYIPKFTASGTVGNSNVTDNGTLVSTTTDMTVNGVKIGKGTGQISTNTAIGFQALNANTTGANNSANGYRSMFTNQTGSGNLGNGVESLYLNLSGSSNVANGNQALYSNSSGTGNLGDGYFSLYSNTTGNYNSANGYQSIYSNTTGSNNLSNGAFSGRFIADKTTAATILNNSIMLGYRTSPLANNQTNQTVIGYDATGLGSNTTVLGNSSTVQTWLGGRLTIGSTVDDGTNAFQLTGSAKLNTAPTTSAGTYDILTRNSSTGVVEKILSTSLQPALGFIPENVANKVTSLASPNNTTYPTTQLLKDQLDLKQDKIDLWTPISHPLSKVVKHEINGKFYLFQSNTSLNTTVPSLEKGVQPFAPYIYGGSYVGVWSAGSYVVGNIVSRNSTLYYCLTNTTTDPQLLLPPYWLKIGVDKGIYSASFIGGYSLGDAVRDVSNNVYTSQINNNTYALATVSDNSWDIINGQPFSVAAWGDSLTLGAGSNGNANYPSVLSSIAGLNIWNGGVSGETSTQIKARFLADKDKWEMPTIIWSGRNNYTSPTTVKSDIAEMVSKLNHTNYLIIGIIKATSDAAEPINTLNSDLKTIYGDRFVDMQPYLLSIFNPAIPQDVIDHGNGVIAWSMRSDWLHLSNLGYSYAAKLINSKINYLLGGDKINASNINTTSIQVSGNVQGLQPVKAIEVLYDDITDKGIIEAYDRVNNVVKPLSLQYPLGSELRLVEQGGTLKLGVIPTYSSGSMKQLGVTTATLGTVQYLPSGTIGKLSKWVESGVQGDSFFTETSNQISLPAGVGFSVGGNTFSVPPSPTQGVFNILGSDAQFLTFSTQSYIYNSSSLFRLLSVSDIDFVAGGSQRLHISSITGKSTFTSTVTAAPATVDTELATLGQVKAVARPYKVYTALLSQSGTSAPTATVLENTLGGTIVWTRVNPGIYSGTLTGAFTTDKTILLNNNPVGGVFTNIFSSVNTITIQTRNYSNAQTDDGLSNTSIEIRVYN